VRRTYELVLLLVLAKDKTVTCTQYELVRGLLLGRMHAPCEVWGIACKALSRRLWRRSSEQQQLLSAVLQQSQAKVAFVSAASHK